MTNATQDVSLLLQLADNASLIGRFVELTERETFIGPIKEITREDDAVTIHPEWFARVDMSTNPVSYKLASPFPFGGREEGVVVFQRSNGTVVLNLVGLGRAIIHPADFSPIAKPTDHTP